MIDGFLIKRYFDHSTAVGFEARDHFGKLSQVQEQLRRNPPRIPDRDAERQPDLVDLVPAERIIQGVEISAMPPWRSECWKQGIVKVIPLSPSRRIEFNVVHSTPKLLPTPGTRV